LRRLRRRPRRRPLFASAGMIDKDAINYTLNADELAQLMPYGETRRHEAGEVLVEPGDREVDLMVTLSGETHIFVDGLDGERRLGWMEPGQFAGDLAVLTGKAVLARTIMGVAGEVLHVPHSAFKRLLVENSRLSDIFVSTFSARRAFALTRRDAGVVLLGKASDKAVFGLRRFLAGHAVPHAFLEVDRDPAGKAIADSKGLSESELPALLLGGANILLNVDTDAAADALGLDALGEGAQADVLVVGAGPAGLAACVYAGSEGLSVILLDEEGAGGQAGSSSKIENYLGFPTGVSGRELADRAAVQAQKFGVQFVSPACASALESLEDGRYRLRLQDGREASAKAVVLAMGAQYRRLPLENLEALEGAGVYYGASPLEAQLCAGAKTVVVGAGNSAGQGAMFLSETAEEMHVLYRRPEIRETMSEYLVRRLEEAGNVFLHPQTEISRLVPDASEAQLASVELSGPDGAASLDAPFVFLFIGAAPRTRWLPAELACDERGFVLTGPAISQLQLVKARWMEDRMPSAYETSLPRVYAVGDVRAGSVKRVASSVGEGSVVVSDVHKALAELSRPEPA